MKLNITPVISMGLILSGCASMGTPRNATGSQYATQQADRFGGTAKTTCRPSVLPSYFREDASIARKNLAAAADRLAEGDRLQLNVAGDKDKLTGGYVIAANGHIVLLGQISIQAAGKSLPYLEREIEDILVDQRLIKSISNGVNLKQIELASVSVSVSGAVFEAGTVRVGTRRAETRSLNISNIVSGDLNTGRMLSTALQAAGGIRPDADPSEIYVTRGGQWSRIDMSGAIDGSLSNDLSISSGDRIFVRSVGCLQEELVRPSPITAPGIRVFMSNLSRPAASNAASAIGKEATSLPYGTRFLQGVVSANCVGGSAMNAGRKAVLISRNPVTGQSVVISRSVEKLVRSANRDDYNPYLMPGDSIACYDSLAMNLRDVVSVISETTSPFFLFKNLD